MFDSEKRNKNTIKQCYHGAKKIGDNLEFNTNISVNSEAPKNKYISDSKRGRKINRSNPE